MAALVLAMLILAMAGHSRATWCVCKRGLSEAVLQKTLDYACGSGADCTLIHQNGNCFNPSTVMDHCNFAVNSYFQKKGQGPGSCDFAGTASVISSDPSTAGCTYPATASSSTVTATPTTTNPNPSSNTSMNPGTTTSPYVTNPSNGVLGGVGTGLGPSGGGINDVSHGGIMVKKSSVVSFLVILFSGIALLWG